MSPDDPRHGTSRGYVIGCRQECCRRAQMIYMKRYRMGQTPRFTDPTGTHRRVQALSALGYSSREIAQAVGHANEWARSVLGSQRITTTTANKVAIAYERLSMTVANGPCAERIRREARAKGWLPPLAWDDDTIDDPDFRPNLGSDHHRKDDIDPVVVERVLAGDVVPTTNAEKREITRRWIADGRSQYELERVTGWKPERYIDRREEGAA